MLQRLDEEVLELEEIEEIHELVERYRTTQDQIRDIWLKKFDQMAVEISRPLGRLELAIDRLGEDQGAFVERLLYEISKPLKSAVGQMQEVSGTLRKKHSELHTLMQNSHQQNQKVLCSVVKLNQQLVERQNEQDEILSKLQEDSSERAGIASKLKIAVGVLGGSVAALSVCLGLQLII